MHNENELVAALKQRDETALAEIFDRYSNRIYRLAVGLLQDEQAADGVVQDTFIRLIERIDTFESRSSLGTWLYRVAYNLTMDRLRFRMPGLELDELDDDNIMPQILVDWGTTPEMIAGNHEAMAQISRAVAGLNPLLSSVFILRDIEQLSTQETADALGLNAGTVKVRLHRARLALREQLAAYFQERQQA